jgi:hypothetical protein
MGASRQVIKPLHGVGVGLGRAGRHIAEARSGADHLLQDRMLEARRQVMTLRLQLMRCG